MTLKQQKKPSGNALKAVADKMTRRPPEKAHETKPTISLKAGPGSNLGRFLHAKKK